MTAKNPLLMEDIDFYRHWHPQSERFAGGDCLATALMRGWVLKAPVVMEVYWCAGSRQVNVYHCDLVRDDDHMHMPVLGNPYMDRLIQQMGLPVISEERKQFLLQAVAPAFEKVSV
jgi:hypothetical protein